MRVFSGNRAARFAALGALCASSAGCPRTPGVTRARVQRELESTDKQVVLAAAAPVVTYATCAVAEAAPAGDAGANLDRGSLSLGSRGARWVGYYDAAAHALGALGPDGVAEHAWPLVAANVVEASAPTVVALDGGEALVIEVLQERAGRAHRVGVAPVAGPVRALFRHPEPADDGFAIAATATSEGALVAWDEEGPAGGVIVGHAVRWPAAAPSAAPGGEGAGPASSAWSDPAHDAADPVLVRAAAPQRGAFLLYLAGRDVESETASQTSADIYVRALDARGAPTSAAVRVTPGPSLRFAVSALSRPDALWVAYRVSTEADHLTSGDGGSVAVLRVAPDGSRTLGEARVHSSADAVPTGEPSLLDDGARGVTLFWAERRFESAVTVRRPLNPDGSARAPARDEPAFRGEIPTAGAASAPWFVRAGERGRPVIVQARCPDA